MSNKILSFFEKEIQSPKLFVKQEFLGGLSTFFAMNYILFVNPLILGNAGLDKYALFTVTGVSIILATLFMALFANWPVTLAPGMGSNAFIAFGVVLGLGIPWQEALAAVFISGLLFFLVTISNFRKYIISAIPPSIQEGLSAGIGGFILLLGLKLSGLVVADPNTLITLGDISSKPFLLVTGGFIFLLMLETLKVQGSVIITVLGVSLLSYFLGESKFSGIVSAPPSMAPLFNQLDFSYFLSLRFWEVVLVVFVTDFFDSTALFSSIATKMKSHLGKDLNLKKPLLVDGLSTSLGAFLGTTTVTTYTESFVGINVGAKTGLSSIFTVLFFALALFFSPLLSLIPSFAIAPALIYIGFSILKGLNIAQFSNDKMNSLTCITVTMMIPFTFSIVYGFLFGLIVWMFQAMVTGYFFKPGVFKQHILMPIIAVVIIAARFFSTHL